MPTALFLNQMDRADPAQSRRYAGRAAEIHVNEGVCDVFEVDFPPKGTLITPYGRLLPTRGRFVLLLRLSRA